MYLFDYQLIIKMLQSFLKKKTKKRTTCQKNVYLCNVLINNDCFTD